MTKFSRYTLMLIVVSLIFSLTCIVVKQNKLMNKIEADNPPALSTLLTVD